MVIGSGIGPLLFGAFFATTGNYLSVLWLCSIIPALLFFGCAWADNPQSKIKSTNSD
jgi:cyanate permease